MIEVRNLTKHFGSKVAVNGVSFEVKKGEVLGFLGPNGAGKSTTMRMITGFIPPSEGSIQVGRHDMLANPIPAQSLIGYLPENAPSYSDMTVGGFLGFAAEMRGLRRDAKKKAVARAVEMCFLGSVFHQSIETLSKGYRHRTCFAQSIIHDPEVLILDEPTDGLDPNQKHEVRTLIRRMGESKAIIFSTHILEEVEAACSRAIIIDRGRVVADGTPAELKLRSADAGVVTVRFAAGDASRAAGKLKGIGLAGRTEVLSESPATIRVFPRQPESGSELARAVLDLASRESWQIEDFRIEEGRLDDVFRAITLPDNNEEAAK